MTYPFVTFDEEADALYVALQDAEVAVTRELGDLRLVDYAADGAVVGVEFVSASQGVDLDGVPNADDVAAAIGDSPFPIKVFA